MRLTCMLATGILTTAMAYAADGGSLELQPESIELIGARARQRLVLTHRTGDKVRDLSPSLAEAAEDIQISVEPAGVVELRQGILVPLSDGEALVRLSVGEQTTTARVTVRGMQEAPPLSFEVDVLGALTKAGCNMGACHGSPTGKGGFRLSLRGYDPELDILTLKSEFSGRRTNVIEPEKSLLLRKPLMEVTHGGGQRFTRDDASYQVLLEWIARGMPVDDSTPSLERIEVIPRQRVFRESGDQQRLIVQGTFSDGSVRDVTDLTMFSSSNESVGTVSEDGVVRKGARGETAILARYLDKMDTAQITFLEDVPGFRWNQPEPTNLVDRHVNAKLLRLQILPSDLSSDSEFLRRVYLDVAGRVPTVDEVRTFLDDLSTDKRSRLIDQLLDSSDYAAFWALKWADVLRVNSGSLKPVGVAKLNRWLYQSVLHDQPMDEFAHELLTSTGSVFENPAASYWRISRDPTDATETTAQLFLGIRIQCAKCHNHPFERWTQDSYYGIAAAFARVSRKAQGDDEVIFLKPSGEVTQPRTGETMKVHLLLQGDVDVPEDQDRRQVFAEWLTQPENPFFARSVVNRIWGHLLGRGIVDPVDDFRDSNPPSNPELLDALAAEFTSSGFSRKHLMRLILNSDTYQRSSRTNDFNANDDRYFSHYPTRMLSAEQLLDSISAVTEVPESFPGMPSGFRAAQLPEPPTNNYFLKVFGQPQRQMACECERSTESNLSQALQMINGPIVHEKLRSDSGRVKRLMYAGADDQAVIKELYLAGVSREPTSSELDAALKHVANSENRRWALEDVGWALLNTKEFLFQH